MPYFTIGSRRELSKRNGIETTKENFTPRYVGKPKGSGDSIAERRERKYERKINDPASTLIIPIHKAWYPDTSATSGLIKNDDREGRKLQAAYRPINSTSAPPATVSSPRPFPPGPPSLPLPSRLVFKHRRCKKNLCNYR